MPLELIELEVCWERIAAHPRASLLPADDPRLLAGERAEGEKEVSDKLLLRQLWELAFGEGS